MSDGWANDPAKEPITAERLMDAGVPRDMHPALLTAIERYQGEKRHYEATAARAEKSNVVALLRQSRMEGAATNMRRLIEETITDSAVQEKVRALIHDPVTQGVRR